MEETKMVPKAELELNEELLDQVVGGAAGIGALLAVCSEKGNLANQDALDGAKQQSK